jgi:hypothetical protein
MVIHIIYILFSKLDRVLGNSIGLIIDNVKAAYLEF